ncbi:glycosyltransferase family 2 protein [Planomicrobium sp. YIM 101495]|uniref:glycosyltransferase family 2 protein n=1 Tax=Planomicrobium sp. YIM 101495 TaxID=2665160 RepID=UPI00351A7FDF
MEKEVITVSICCLSYNHEPYLADAIESFLSQKTDFSFEVLIHDDASTDRSAAIIKEYEEKYPYIIKAMYQTENQYSQGVLVDLVNQARARGKYLAYCEGDDYWTDPTKLQRQVDYMEAHPECSMSVHAASTVSALKKKVLSDVRPSVGDRDLTVEELIEGGGEFVATNSILLAKEKIEPLPEFFHRAVVGDYPLVIYGGLQGAVHYMDRNMSAYRVGVSGSWTQRELATVEKKGAHMQEIARMLDEINEYTDYRYDRSIRVTKERNELHLLLEQGRVAEAKKGKYREQYNQLSLKKIILFRIKHSFPNVARLLKAIRWGVSA